MIEIRNRFTGTAIYGADAETIKIAVEMAVVAKINLSGADLSGADLSGAYLVDGGQRSDGYRFVGWIKDGVLQIRAGCRDLTITKARAHWSSENYPNRERGDETMCILDHIERVAEIRRLVDKVEQNDG